MTQTPRLLVIDNYDSFTFNLVQLIGGLAQRGERAGAIEVLRNDAVSLDALLSRPPAAVLLSPGPGLPTEAGLCVELVRRAPPTLSMFGVCLGMQIIAEALGASVVRAPQTMHGRTSVITHDGRGCFASVPQGAEVMRYHSWAVAPASLPEMLEPTAWAPDGVLMGLRHRTRPIEAVQFHPESFLTQHGAQMLEGFVRGALAPARGELASG